MMDAKTEEEKRSSQNNLYPAYAGSKINFRKFADSIPLFVENYLDSMFAKMDVLHSRSEMMKTVSVGYTAVVDQDTSTSASSSRGKQLGASNIAVSVPTC